MASKDVIYPQRSLFLVDKSFQGSRKGAKASVRASGEPICIHQHTKVDPQFVRNAGKHSTLSHRAGQITSADTPQTDESQESRAASTTDVPKQAAQLQFVTSTDGSGFKDKDTRRLIKSHASRQVIRKRGPRLDKAAREQLKRTLPSNGIAGDPPSSEGDAQKVLKKRERFPAYNVSFGPLNLGSAAFFYATLPSTSLKADRLHQLLTHYYNYIGQSAYPLQSILEYNPLQKEWIQSAVHDQVFFQVVIYAASSAIFNHSHDVQLYREKSKLAETALSGLNLVLRHPDELTVGTVSAVACLAMVGVSLLGFSESEDEAHFGAAHQLHEHHGLCPLCYRYADQIPQNMSRHFDLWHTHMNGLTQLVHVVGFENLNESTKLKIYRADCEGAANFVSQLHLPPLQRRHPPLFTMIPSDPSDHTLSSLSSSPLHTSKILSLFTDTLSCSHTLIGTYTVLIEFVTAIICALHRKYISQTDSLGAGGGVHGPLNPRAFDEDVIGLQQRLLSSIHSLPLPTASPLLHSLNSADMERANLERSLNLAALAFMKLLTRQPLQGSYSTWELARQTREAAERTVPYLSSLSMIQENAEIYNLCSWILVIGGIISPTGSQEKEWFLEILSKRFPYVGAREDHDDDSGEQGNEDRDLWDNVENKLEECLWVRGLLSPIGRMLFAMVEEKGRRQRNENANSSNSSSQTPESSGNTTESSPGYTTSASGSTRTTVTNSSAWSDDANSTTALSTREGTMDR